MDYETEINNALIAAAVIHPQIAEIDWTHKATKTFSKKKKVRILDKHRWNPKIESRECATVNEYIFSYLYSLMPDWEHAYETTVRTTKTELIVELDGRPAGKIGIDAFRKAQLANIGKEPKCPKCKNTMILKQPHDWLFWSCISYPSCKGTASSTLDHPKVVAIIKSSGDILHQWILRRIQLEDKDYTTILAETEMLIGPLPKPPFL